MGYFWRKSSTTLLTLIFTGLASFGPAPASAAPGGANASAGAGGSVQAQPIVGIDSVTPIEGPMQGGFTVTVTGVGFVPGQTGVRICDIDIPPAGVPVNPQGNILTFTAPGCTAAQTQLLVTTPTGSASTVFVYDQETLPVTGSQIGAPLTAGTGLIAVGALALLLARRRPRTAEVAVTR